MFPVSILNELLFCELPPDPVFNYIFAFLSGPTVLPLVSFLSLWLLVSIHLTLKKSLVLLVPPSATLSVF